MKRTRAFRLQWNIYRVRHRFPQTTIPLTEALELQWSYQLDLSVARLTKQPIDMAPTTRSRSAKVKKPASNILQPSKVNKRSRPGTKVAARKPTKSENLNGSQQISRLKPPRGRTYPVKHLENGLVSMETPPDYLVETWGWYSYARNCSADLLRIQKNATDSPLLRLPAEIRNTIFRYAVGGNKIRIRRAVVYRTSKKWRENSNLLWHGRADHLDDRRFKDQGTAFHLPEVCRQIYAETATLGYATNIFILPYTQGLHQYFDEHRSNGRQLLDTICL
jgi:hypothetical protein